MRLRAISCAALVVACSFDHRGLDSGGTPRPDAEPPGSDGSIDAPLVADANPEDPDATPCVVECIDTTSIRDCPGGGTTTCPLGCVTAGDDHCAAQVVSNDPLADMHLLGVPATADLVVDVVPDDPSGGFYSHWKIFTDTGEIIDENTATTHRPAGTGVDAATGIGFYTDVTGVGVFVFDTVTIDQDARLWVYGARALLILSRGDVVVNGVIDVTAGVSADATTASVHFAGPGGFEGGVGTGSSAGCAGGGHGAEGSGGSVDETGGGGGALAVGRNGAAGGDGPVSSGDFGGPGGVPTVGPCPSASVVPLEGGSGGGAGGATATAGGIGGGGGGAAQVTSFTSITFAQTGLGLVGVWAGGAGGSGGGSSNGGGGGGSGGAILLEAPEVTVGAGTFLAANGGGGGAGGSTGPTAAGTLGGTGATPALGGAGLLIGGSGGAGLTNPIQGAGDADGTGGGGGAVGIVAINTLDGSAMGVISPAVTVAPLPVE